MFVSEYLNIDNLETAGVFDAIVDADSNFFINILRLKETNVPELSRSYEKINIFFNGIATLLSTAKEKNLKDKFFKAAYNKFNFSEVNGINLGFSESGRGSGMGKALRLQVLEDAYDIVQQGSKEPEIFHLVGLFEDNIGPDRLSDMIATIIEDDIKEYTLRVQKDFGINPSSSSKIKFHKSGLVYNPYKKCPLLLLPTEILHELPIARFWEDIDQVVSENQSIRDEINHAVGDEWYKWASTEKKKYIRESIFKNPVRCARVIEKYRTQTIESYNPYENVDYFVAKLWEKIKKSGFSFISNNKVKDTKKISLEILSKFSDWVENNRGWEVIQSVESKKREKIVQRVLHLCALAYIDANNIDVNCEPDEGRGPVNFKISRGTDKTLIELKLSTNQQYLHGYETQIVEYGKAENTDSLIYVLLDLGHPRKIKKIRDLHYRNQVAGIEVPELIIIDTTEKSSASVYEDSLSEEDEQLLLGMNLSLGDFNIDIDNIDLSIENIDLSFNEDDLKMEG